MEVSISIKNNVRERYRELFHNSLDLIFVIDINGNFIDANDIALDTFGYKREEISDIMFTDLVDEEQTGKMINALKEIIKNGRNQNYIELKIKSKAGDSIYIETYGIPIKENGRVYAIIGIANDITARKKTEEKLMESENILKKMLRELNCVYSISTILDSPEISINELLENIVELIPHACQFPALTCARIIYDNKKYDSIDFKENEWKFSTRVIVNEKPLKISVHFLENIPFLKSERDLITEIGNRLRIIIEQKESEQKLKESEEKYRSILENIKEGYFEVDLRGNYTFFNDYFCETLGYTKEDVIGMNYNVICDEETAKSTFKAYNEVYTTEIDKPSFEHESVKKNGEVIYIETSIYLKRDIQGNKIGFYGLARDITERKIAEQKLKESEEKYRLISENANDLIATVNDKFEYDYINENVHKKIMGYSNEDLIGKSSLDFLYPEDVEFGVKTLRKGFAKGEEMAEMRIKDKNGSYRWFEIRGTTFTDIDGKRKGILISRDINERKIAEKMLKESEKKYRVISENAYDLISVLNEKFEYEYINEKVYKNVLGYSKEDLIGQTAVNMVHPKDVGDVMMNWRRGIKKGEESGEVRYKKKDGSYIWLEFRGTTFTDIDGKRKGVLISRDINERKIAEKMLKESEKKYRVISENAYDLISVLNEKFEYEYINEKVHKDVLGYSKEDLIGQIAANMVHPNDVRGVIKKWRKGINTDERSGELRYKRKDGFYIWLEVRGTMFQKSDGKFKGIMISRDITKRKNAEHKLKRSEEKYRSILENMMDGYVEVDLKGNYTFVNKRVGELLGYSKEELLSMNFRQVATKASAINMLKSFNSLYNNEISDFTFDFKAITKDGQHKFLEASAYLKYDSLGKKIGFKGLFRDITEKKEAEELIKQEREKLKELDLLKRNLTTQLSEKLKYPLSVISDVSEVLLESYHDQLDKNAQKLIELIRDGGEKSSNMIERILDISKIESDKFELNKKVENINQIINESIHRAYEDLEFRDVGIDLRSTEDLFAEVDKVRFKQIFEYFLISSLKMESKKGNISILLKEEDNYAEIQIKSSGIELKYDEYPFEIQYSDDIMKLHQGSINREYNREEKSSKIIIRLPIISWFNQLIHIFVIYKTGILLYDHPFVKEKDRSDSMIISGGLIGTMSMLKEIIKGKEHIDHIDHGDREIMFELNKTEEIVFALLVKEENPVIRRKLNSLIRDFEEYYKEKIKDIKYTSMRSNEWIEVSSLIEKHFKFQD